MRAISRRVSTLDCWYNEAILKIHEVARKNKNLKMCCSSFKDMLFFLPTITPKMQMKYKIDVLSQVPGPQIKLFAFLAAKLVRFNTILLANGFRTLHVVFQVCYIYRRICYAVNGATCSCTFEHLLLPNIIKVMVRVRLRFSSW